MVHVIDSVRITKNICLLIDLDILYDSPKTSAFGRSFILLFDDTVGIYLSFVTDSLESTSPISVGW